MNIKILDSWLREYLKTKANAKTIADKLSLSSASIERIEEYKNDKLYDIEITTNRVDMASVIGLAREAGVVLPQAGSPAEFVEPKLSRPKSSAHKAEMAIINDHTLVHRICAVVMDVTIKDSPQVVKDRLESTGIRSLNNVIDVTNYIMREIGHPAHVFDYDRLQTKKLVIRESKKGEKITTLDNKTYTLSGGDIVAEDGKGTIVDLLGVMGLQNSVVTDKTKRILLFIDTCDKHKIRKTSMGLGIRTEAAQLNEKGIDPELAMTALLRGIDLYKELAEGVVISDIIDIYPNKYKPKTITISQEKINTVIGVEIKLSKASELLTKLGFTTKSLKNKLQVTVPSWRANDVEIEEDIIEEIARIYGYHNIPTELPPLKGVEPYNMGKNMFYFEQRAKDALKYWGFTEVYTYSFVSEELYEGPVKDAVTVQNPLTSDFVYMRSTLTPSLLQVLKENKAQTEINIFEIAKVYHQKPKQLPDEVVMLAGVIKKPHLSFYHIKGIVEQLTNDLGIEHLKLKKLKRGGYGADVYVSSDKVGEIEILENDLMVFELNFDLLRTHATLTKKFTPLAKYPPIIEDIALVVEKSVSTEEIIEEIKSQSSLIVSVTLLDEYKNSRTFHILYQHKEKNLMNEDVAVIREQILKAVESKFGAKLKV
jgi:phenylalanyl-tRNA synthetase beta chain